MNHPLLTLTIEVPETSFLSSTEECFNLHNDQLSTFSCTSTTPISITDTKNTHDKINNAYENKPSIAYVDGNSQYRNSSLQGYSSNALMVDSKTPRSPKAPKAHTRLSFERTMTKKEEEEWTETKLEELSAIAKIHEENLNKNKLEPPSGVYAPLYHPNMVQPRDTSYFVSEIQSFVTEKVSRIYPSKVTSSSSLVSLPSTDTLAPMAKTPLGSLRCQEDGDSPQRRMKTQSTVLEENLLLKKIESILHDEQPQHRELENEERKKDLQKGYIDENNGNDDLKKQETEQNRLMSVIDKVLGTERHREEVEFEHEINLVQMPNDYSVSIHKKEKEKHQKEPSDCDLSSLKLESPVYPNCLKEKQMNGDHSSKRRTKNDPLLLQRQTFKRFGTTSSRPMEKSAGLVMNENHSTRQGGFHNLTCRIPSIEYTSIISSEGDTRASMMNGFVLEKKGESKVDRLKQGKDDELYSSEALIQDPPEKMKLEKKNAMREGKSNVKNEVKSEQKTDKYLHLENKNEGMVTSERAERSEMLTFLTEEPFSIASLEYLRRHELLPVSVGTSFFQGDTQENRVHDSPPELCEKELKINHHHHDDSHDSGVGIMRGASYFTQPSQQQHHRVPSLKSQNWKAGHSSSFFEGYSNVLDIEKIRQMPKLRIAEGLKQFKLKY